MLLRNDLGDWGRADGRAQAFLGWLRLFELSGPIPPRLPSKKGVDMILAN